jgi:cytochrome c oxidase subunit 4
MAEAQVLSPTEVEEEHLEESQSPYLRVWLALMVLTVVECLAAVFLKDWFAILLVGLLVLAATQVVMMGWWSMHLKFEGMWAIWLIVVAAVISAIVVLALVPDIAFRSAESGGDVGATVPAAAPAGSLETPILSSSS